MILPISFKIEEIDIKTSTKPCEDSYEAGPITMELTLHVKDGGFPWLLQIWKNKKMVKRLRNKMEPTRSLFALDKEMKRIRRKGNRICRLIEDTTVNASSKTWQNEVDSYCNMVNSHQKKISELCGLKKF